MIEFTPRAAEILRRSTDAARRFNPGARIRVFRKGDVVEFALADETEPGDREVEGEGFGVLVAEGVEGVVAVVEPHDRLVLRPAGSSPLPGEVLEAGGH
jgi:Fe-S cluster assembly iron-binding protein IscA